MARIEAGGDDFILGIQADISREYDGATILEEIPIVRKGFNFFNLF